ncbi:MAG: hypothetical protein FD152_2092 [Xanthobacteraceae bacterium]|nr:MAG: hypothetical protein FD152_2092 [Xanthobacteraceae bacterium]
MPPPSPMERRSVRRKSIRRPLRSGAKRRVGTASSGNTSAATRRLASAISAAVIWAKSFFCSTSTSETVRLASTSISGFSTGTLSACLKKASCRRSDTGSGLPGCTGATGKRMESSFSIRWRFFQKISKAVRNSRECSCFDTKTECRVQ